MSSLSEELSSYTAVILTGGSSGIGKSFIGSVAKLNPRAVICNLSRRVPDINGGELNLRHFPCDLGVTDEIGRTALEVLGFIDRTCPTGRVLLINNSGFGAYGHFPEPNLEHQLTMIDVNVRAVVELTARLLPWLKKRGGAVLTVASTAAFQPTAYMATYGATKAFVLHWSLALNEELRGSGLRTLAICPGPTSTEFFRRAGLQEGSVADSLGQTSEEVVAASLRALASGRSLVVTGWKNKISTAVAARLSKPLSARVGAAILARFRLSKKAAS